MGRIPDTSPFEYPPFCRLIRVTFKNKNFHSLNQSTEWYANVLKQLMSVKILGPTFPTVPRIRNLYIKEILIKIDSNHSINSTKKHLLKVQNSFESIEIFDDLKKIKSLGIKTVCDFRSDDELKEFPSPFSLKTLPILKHVPIKTLGTRDLKELSVKKDVTSDMMTKELEDHYILYVHQHKKKYQDFINLIAFGDIPLVFHCFAGKDRTGFGSLLYLGILGVKKEIIIEDYLLTNKFYMGPIVNEDWRDATSETLRPLFEARVNYIDAAFTEIFNKYNTI